MAAGILEADIQAVVGMAQVGPVAGIQVVSSLEVAAFDPYWGKDSLPVLWDHLDIDS